MATRIEVVSAYGPRLESAGLLTPEFLAAHIESRTGYTAGTVKGIQLEVSAAIREFTPLGMGMIIDGMGIVRPWMQHNGRIKLRMRFNTRIEDAVNQALSPHNVRNSKNIGLPIEDLIEIWNHDHPDDPVVD